MESGLPYTDIDEGLPYEYRLPPVLILSAKRLRRATEEVELSDELVRAVPVREGEVWLRDTRSPGLALRIRDSGTKTFYLLVDTEKPLYPDANGQEARRKALGSIDDLSVAQARTYAELLRKEIVVEAPKPNLRRGVKVAELFSKFEIENSSESSDWSSRRNCLLRNHLLPAFGDAVASGIGKREWMLLAQKVSLDQKSRGEHLLKALKVFLWWAVKRGALEVNPISRQGLLLPERKPRRSLDITDLAMIFEGASRLSAPWNAIFGLMILTGMPFEEVRKVHQCDIEWGPRIWCTGRHADPYRPTRHMHISAPAFRILEAYRRSSGYLFVSERNRTAPINLYADVMDNLRSHAGIRGVWGLRDCRRALRRQLGRIQPSRNVLEQWAEQLISEQARLRDKREAEHNEVVL